jgi:hypothetical protein
MAYADLILDTPGLVAYWRLAERSGTVARDELQAHDGTYVGAVTLDRPALLTQETNPAAHFDGTSHVQIGNPPSLNFSTALTLEAWAKRSAQPASGNYDGIIWKGDDWDLAGLSGAIDFSVNTSGDGYVDLVGGTFPVDEVVHLICRWDGTTLSGFVNGEQVVSGPATGTLVQSSDPVVIAIDSNPPFQGYGFNGVLDEVAIYNVALTEAQIREHHRVGSLSGFAQPEDVGLRLGRTLNDSEYEQTRQVIDIVTGLIIDAVDRDTTWATSLFPVPSVLKALCVEKAIAAVVNPQGYGRVHESLGAYSKDTTFRFRGTADAELVGVFLTPAEERTARNAVYGVLTGSSTPRSLEDRLIDLREIRNVDELPDADDPDWLKSQ